MDVAHTFTASAVSYPVPATLNGLHSLHRAHLLAIAFENLHVPLGQLAGCVA